MATADEDKKDEATKQPTTAESGATYEGDGTVVGDNDRLGGEESLAPPPTPHVQYGGPTEVAGDGMRRPGPFRAMFQCRANMYSNLVAIPYRRVG